MVRFACPFVFLLLLGSAPGADPKAPAELTPAAVLRALADRAAEKGLHQEFWKAVLLTARPDLEAGRNRSYWASFIQPEHVQIVSLRDPVPVTIRDEVRGRDLSLDCWVVATPVAVAVVTRPAANVPADTRRAVHEGLLRRAEAQAGDGVQVQKQKAAWRAELKSVGPEDCGRVLVPVLTVRGGIDPATLKLTAADTQLKVTFRGKEQTHSLPAEAALAERLAHPLGVPGRPRLALALDWSEQLADAENRVWLTAALKTAFADLTDEDLLDGGVHLQTPERAGVWSLKDIHAGTAPGGTEAHKGDTLPTLEAAVRRTVGATGGAKLVFLTWNPGTSIPKADQTARDPFGAPNFRPDAGKVELEVVQVLGERLECFGHIRKGHYYVCEDDDRDDRQPGRRVATQLRRLLGE